MAKKQMTTHFDNVTISIAAENPKAAYLKLCEMFETLGADLDYTTDTFRTNEEPENDRGTDELWPE